MNKISIKKIPFKLTGDIIKKNQILIFKGVDENGKEQNIKQFSQIKIISVFPAINTKICGEQTKKTIELAKKFPNLVFVAVSMDQVETIKKWCLNHQATNIHVWSDYQYQDFATQTNLLIKRLKKLARGFFILDANNKIIELNFKKELTVSPDYEWLLNQLNSLNKNKS